MDNNFMCTIKISLFFNLDNKLLYLNIVKGRK